MPAKKRRFFGPFKRMKRFFTSRIRTKSKEDETVAGVGFNRAKSTNDVLNAPTDEDTEDEG